MFKLYYLGREKEKAKIRREEKLRDSLRLFLCEAVAISFPSVQIAINRHFLSTYYVSGTVLGIRDTMVSKRGDVTALGIALLSGDVEVSELFLRKLLGQFLRN